MRRRLPPAASPKPAKPEDRPNARDLLASVNSASSGASTSWIAFLGAMAYLAVTLSGITHVDLLLDRETTLPFVSVKVPLTAFFVAAPLAFVLVHFGLLLQHVVLSRKLRAFEERLWKENPTRNRRGQPIRDELHSYSFTQSVSGMPKGAAVDIALRLVMSLTLVVFPLLLTFFQIGFLPYHFEPITWWHRGMLVADAAVIVVLAQYLAKRDRPMKVKLTDWWHGRSALREGLTIWCRRRLSVAWWALGRAKLQVRGRDYGPAISRIVRPALKALRDGGTLVVCSFAYVFSPSRFVIGVLVLFSFCVATLPDSPHASVPLDKWMASMPLLGRPVPFGEGGSCPSPDGATRCAFRLTARLFERKVDEETGKADSLFGWSRNLIVTDKTPVEDEKKETRLNLRGRDLRYATLARSNLKRADFFGADLERASFVRTDLNASNFRTASLQGADLSDASLQGAILAGAGLQGANLSLAQLQGADLSWAQLQGADLSRAQLQGADLSWAQLQGAVLSRASLWRSGLPGDRGAPMPGDSWDMVSFAGLSIGPPDDDERKEFAKTVAKLEKLTEVMAKESAGGRARVEAAAERIADGLRPLLESEGDDAWKGGDEFRGWCGLAQQPPPDPLKLSTYLGVLARDDDTDKAYMAQLLIDRALDLVKPNSFLEALKGSPAFNRIPAGPKSRLEQAAQQERERAANAKANPQKAEQPAQSEAPPICARLDKEPAGPTTGSAKPN